MAQQDTLIHIPHKMRRVVKDTAVTESGAESRYECPICQKSVWRPLSADGQQQLRLFMCDGRTVGTILPMPLLDPHAPKPQELTDLLREILHQPLHPRLRLRIIAMVRRLRSVD